MTITESITKAMKDLGVPNCDISLDNPQPEKPEKKVAKKSADKKKKKDIDMSECMNPPVEDTADESSEVEDPTVFCKIHNGKMVLFFPKDCVFDTTTFGNTELNTLTFESPDFESSKLQELQIIAKIKQKQPEIVRVPIFFSQQEKETSQHLNDAESSDDLEDDLEDLQAEKTRLTGAIKSARESGDENVVNELRKQRRIVRNKINKLIAGD